MPDSGTEDMTTKRSEIVFCILAQLLGKMPLAPLMARTA